MPIPYMTLRAYAHDAGLYGEDFHLFRVFFGMLDDEWLKRVAAKAKVRERESNDR